MDMAKYKYDHLQLGKNSRSSAQFDGIRLMANLWRFFAPPKEPLILHIDGNEPLTRHLSFPFNPNLSPPEAARPLPYHQIPHFGLFDRICPAMKVAMNIWDACIHLEMAKFEW
jgi:hypothetical protein